jgi:CRISPR-associated protein Csb1
LTEAFRFSTLLDKTLNNPMNVAQLRQAVQSAAGLRLRLRLQPLYGAGEVIFPCTVAGGKYQTSKRRIPGYEDSVDCTIIDSVQSQANRMEDALLADIRAGNIFIPHVVTDFSGVEGLEKPVGSITCFEAPHRVFDAILRDSVDAGGIHFPHTPEGKAAVAASSRDASALFVISPASLLFGSWDSTGVSGGLGEKYARCMVSELVAVNCNELVDSLSDQRNRSGVRRDPLNISASVDCVKLANEHGMEQWTQRQGKTSRDKASAAVINHGNVVWPKSGETLHGGVTCAYIHQSTTISLPALRQLGFPINESERSAAARTVLAAIALHAAALMVEKGWHLRSRCDLTLEDGQSVMWETIGGDVTSQPLAAEATRKILTDAIEAAKKAGLAWRDEPIKLTPSKALAELVVKSQKAHRETANAG